MNVDDVVALRSGDRAALYHFFILHYESVRKLATATLSPAPDDELTTIITIGIFRDFFRILPKLLADSPGADLQRHLAHVATQRCHSYQKNLVWVNCTRDKLLELVEGAAKPRVKGVVVNIDVGIGEPGSGGRSNLFNSSLESEIRTILSGKNRTTLRKNKKRVKRGMEDA